MLILTRRPGDTVLIDPRLGANKSDPPDWFTRPIEERILRMDGNHVRIGIEAADGLRIWRGERDDNEGR
jgi:sRNA-binding carbon storage regulator CsrA